MGSLETILRERIEEEVGENTVLCISFAFKNRKLIKQLTKRGKFLANNNFT